MIGELGQLALCLALVLSLAQAVSGFWGASRGDAQIMAMSRGSALGVFVFVGFSFLALTYAYVGSDFSVLAVAQYSHTAKPLIYKISGVWANHEGSMLLWILILAIYSAVMAVTVSGGEQLNARALGVQALIAVAFLLFVLLTSNPFLRLDPPPFEGAGLNPLLQDPGLAFHPPLLYFGYVGLSAAFSFAAASLIAKRNDAAWVRAARPYATLAWTALTLGIAAGSWWAYYTLGWGGFWFWDPVENASLMPWLVGTALFHSMMATERTGAFKSWTLLLSIAAFSFSLIGTFLVRSGVLNSVHSFANDPERGVFILAILVVSIGVPLALFAIRAPKLSAGAPFQPASRESAILINNLLLTACAATVLIGTLYPLVLDALEGVKISVGPPFFTYTVIPLMVVLAICLPFGPMLNWRRGDLKAAAYQLRYALAASGLAVVAVLFMASPRSLLGSLAVLLGIWLIAGAGLDVARRSGSLRQLKNVTLDGWSSALAHAGMGILALGVAGSTVWRSETLAALTPGQSMKVANYDIKLIRTETGTGPNYTAERAIVAVLRDGKEIARLAPEKRNFPVEGQTATHSSIRTTGFEDLHVVLGDARDNGRYVLRAYHNPLAPFIWFGAIFMGLGGALAVLARRTQRKTLPLSQSAAESRA